MRSHSRLLNADSSFHLHLNSYHWYLFDSENLKMKVTARSFEKAMNLTKCAVIKEFAMDCCRIQEVLLRRLCWCLPQYNFQVLPGSTQTSSATLSMALSDDCFAKKSRSRNCRLERRHEKRSVRS